jgi:predicted pyridoxine 5'-phosphate oxidase superfamily flavin-nucleotide-binding protein
MTSSSPLKLTPEISALITGALDTGNVLLLAAVDRDGKPILSFRGSTAVFSETQLSFWARNAAGGTLDAISQNPNVALMYRSQSIPLLQFAGRARIADDSKDRDRVFGLAHEKERATDPERKGRAVIIDLNEVKGVLGFGSDGPIFCHMRG